MSYTVVWQTSAEQKLAEIRLSAPDRNAVARAADTADDALRSDPLSAGESRSADKRIMFVPPLVFYFEVSEPDRLVTVRTVRRARRAL